MSDLQQQDRSASFAQGLKLIQQLGGADRPAVLDLFESIGEAEFGEQCVGFIYGDVYHRPGLPLPERQLATVAALTALGYAGSQLQFHAKAALNVGCTRRQLIEAVIHVSSFAGFPATLNALTALKAAFEGLPEEEQQPEDAADLPWAGIEDRYERGLAAMKAVDGEAGERVAEALRDIAPDLATYIVEFTFGEIYSRPHLSLRHREIVTIAACVALGTALPQLKVHIHGLLNVGGTEQEVVETVLHLAFYCGFPAALNAIAAAREVFAQR
ncbi:MULTISPECIES: carboxymuconolactone decarboxylase family protein [unclassified Amycolatopsis]|uniref:carboxymuconolactone decarboxylase family protein n=1 Tax=unclassified Amycolatopsis TaxID=2618356 RepID=UPI002876ACD9|nr:MULTISPECIES: carboxymuconolactone decarboxylase family protein [unclassified Amycolatopsis]MDS0137215.1 carboxymuconolactone decarboxylase family protein [Amycolatopsis sp. 505]MDS0143880.1 carboxymuconolactone decarboxylase family protein [Amycolatopsis sp. CM201R]